MNMGEGLLQAQRNQCQPIEAQQNKVQPARGAITYPMDTVLDQKSTVETRANVAVQELQNQWQLTEAQKNHRQPYSPVRH